MKKKFLGIICFIYSGIIIYTLYTNNLKNFLAPNMQLYIKLSIIPMILIGLVLFFNSHVHYRFKVTDLILLLPLIMIIIAGDGRLTEKLSSNRTGFTREKSNEIEEPIIIDEPIEEIDLTNPYFNINDYTYGELANYITYEKKGKKFIGKTIRVKGFAQKYISYIPEGYAVIGKYLISCCAADAEFIGFFIKYDTSKISSNDWYEVEGVLKQGKDNDGYDILYIDVENIKKIDSKKEEMYVYSCYAYGSDKCDELANYDLEY